MFNGWFGKHQTTDPWPGGSEKNGNGNYNSSERNENVKRLLGPAPDATDQTDRDSCKPAPRPSQSTLEQIYDEAAVKPPKLAYGIRKVAEMANSPHLVGMAPESKRKAVLMALEAAHVEVAQVLNDLAIRKRALKEYEESSLARLNQFETAQSERNRLLQAELDKITSQFSADIQANLDEVECQRVELRDWQKNKQQELQQFAEASALCLPDDREEKAESDGKLTAVPRAVGAYR